MSRPFRLKTLPLLLALVSLLAIGAAYLAEGPEEILGALPVVAICLALGFDFYPGEKLIERLARRRSRPRPARRLTVSRRTAPRALRPRGSALLAFNLATRPPPPALAG
jgi:hypothetical protein